jgi:hypothetical protein
LQPSLLQVPSLLPPQIAIFRYKLCGTLIFIEAAAPVNIILIALSAYAPYL